MLYPRGKKLHRSLHFMSKSLLLQAKMLFTSFSVFLRDGRGKLKEKSHLNMCCGFLPKIWSAGSFCFWISCLSTFWWTRLVFIADVHLSLFQWIQMSFILFYSRNRGIFQMRRALRRPPVQPPAQSRVSHEIRPHCSGLFPVGS